MCELLKNANIWHCMPLYENNPLAIDYRDFFQQLAPTTKKRNIRLINKIIFAMGLSFSKLGDLFY